MKYEAEADESSATLFSVLGMVSLGFESASWEWEKTVETPEECAELLRIQSPFHFAGEPPPSFAAETVFQPEVLRYFASAGYGDFDYGPDLHRVAKPTLVLVGSEDRVTTPRAAQVLHEGIEGSELVVLDGVGHMSMVEAQDTYLRAVSDFLARLGEGKTADILRRS